VTRDLNLQGSLFDLLDSTTSFDTDFSRIERTDLGNGAWVERQIGWAAQPDQLFVQLLENLEWQDGVERIRGEEVPRPRQVATLARDDIAAGLETIGEMSDALTRRYEVVLDRITCNLYRDGRDSVAWHGDRVARDLPEATVAILSLGEARPFRIRPKGGGASMGWPAGRGDLIVMGGSCQRTFDHSIPKVASAGPRIAVMFRNRYTSTN
jgi:alkylated DNA repair dioxygenase AlkB